MPKRYTRWLVVGLIAAGSSVVGPLSGAQAAPLLEIRAAIDGGPFTLDVVDNGPGDNNPAVGIIALGSATVPINFGGLLVFGSVSSSNAPGGVLSQVASQSLQVVNTSGATHTVLLQISDRDFNLPPSPLTLSGTASGTFSPVTGTGNTQVGGSTATALAFADPGDVKFVNGFLVQNFTTGPPAAAGTPLLSYANTQSAGPLSYATAYSMTVQLTYTLPNNVQLNSRSDVIQAVSAAVVPEPSTVVMALSGLPLLGGLWLRRRQRRA